MNTGSRDGVQLGYSGTDHELLVIVELVAGRETEKINKIKNLKESNTH